MWGFCDQNEWYGKLLSYIFNLHSNHVFLALIAKTYTQGAPGISQWNIIDHCVREVRDCLCGAYNKTSPRWVKLLHWKDCNLQFTVGDTRNFDKSSLILLPQLTTFRYLQTDIPLSHPLSMLWHIITYDISPLMWMKLGFLFKGFSVPYVIVKKLILKIHTILAKRYHWNEDRVYFIYMLYIVSMQFGTPANC